MSTQETQVRSLGQEDPLEQEMETHSSILAWKMPWIEEPDGLQSMELQKLGHNEWLYTFQILLYNQCFPKLALVSPEEILKIQIPIYPRPVNVQVGPENV